jgi:hypothetical protein
LTTPGSPLTILFISRVCSSFASWRILLPVSLLRVRSVWLKLGLPLNVVLSPFHGLVSTLLIHLILSRWTLLGLSGGQAPFEILLSPVRRRYRLQHIDRALIFVLSRLMECIRIILYHHQPSTMAKALIQYHNCRCRREHSFYSLCLTPPDLVRVGRQTY